jgi:hypothetical protein
VDPERPENSGLGKPAVAPVLMDFPKALGDRQLRICPTDVELYVELRSQRLDAAKKAQGN